MAENETIRQKRTVVLVGKSGSGKSSLANRLAHSSTTFLVKRTYESVTEDVGIAVIEVDVDYPSEEDGKFKLKIVDTAGFSGTNKKLNNFEVLKKIQTFFQIKSPGGVNLVLFVFSGTRFTQEEREAFDFLTENLKTEISEASALVLTHCESLDDNGRHSLVRDFKTNDLTRSYAEFMGKGIYTVGFPDLKLVHPQLKPIYQQTAEKDQQSLMDLVLSPSKTYKGNEMFKEVWRCTIL